MTYRDFELYGYTKGCTACIYRKSGKKPGAHDKHCRERIEAELAKTEEGRRRLEAATQRQEDYEREVVEDEGTKEVRTPAGEGEGLEAAEGRGKRGRNRRAKGRR